MNDLRIPLWLAAAIAFLVAPAWAADDFTWKTEAGFLVGYHDNYFYLDNDQPSDNEVFLTVYGQGNVAIDSGPGDLLLDAGGLGAFGLQIADTTYEIVNAGVGYQWDKTRVKLAYRHTFDRPFGEEDDNTLYDVGSGEFRLRQEITDSLRVRGSFQVQKWYFPSSDDENDALEYKALGLLRWEICDCFAVRSSFFWTWKNADDNDSDYDGPGFSVAAEVTPTDPLSFQLRYRRRWRDYDAASADDSNYKRDDTIDDVLATARWKVTDVFGLRLAGTYRHGGSSRSDRRYDAGSVTGGFFITFDGAR